MSQVTLNIITQNAFETLDSINEFNKRRLIFHSFNKEVISFSRKKKLKNNLPIQF